MDNKKQIFLFLIITFVASYALELYVLLNGGVSAFGMWMLITLMWIPGLSSLIVRLIAKDWRDIGLLLGHKKYYLISFITPFLLSLIAFYLCSLLNIREAQFISGVPLSKVLNQLLFIFFIGLFSALGEEIGWRGFLTPKIYLTNIKFPTFVSGLAWSAWHLPLVAFGGYYQNMNPLTTVALYTVMILTLNICLNWIRLASGSMFTATFLHAFYNFFFQTFWIALLFRTPGENIKLWNILGGDMGLLVSILFMILIFISYKLGAKISSKKESM